jgi:hypothetical protein
MTAILFHHKLLGEDGSVRQDVVMVKQPGLFSPNFGATSSHVLTHLPQDVVVEHGIHSLSFWDLCFALPQLLYRWIPPRTVSRLSVCPFALFIVIGNCLFVNCLLHSLKGILVFDGQN